jgi:hypothetical protein
MFYHPAKVPTLNTANSPLTGATMIQLLKQYLSQYQAQARVYSVVYCFLMVFMCSLRSGLLLFAEKLRSNLECQKEKIKKRKK